jgi:molybdopterin/thiamine biosynthesis adenylyltransferase
MIMITGITMHEFYRRQVKLIGEEAQLRLSSASVLIIGAGGLGHPVASYLTGAGVGTIHIADFDRVEESNLHRQTLFKHTDCGKNKALALTEVLTQQNPHLTIFPHPFAFNSDTAPELLQGIDLVIDATDNFTAKFLIHEKCHERKIPLLQGSIISWQGHLHFFDFKDDSACLECLYPLPPQEGCVSHCAEAGILGSTAGVFGTLMANEALKFFVGLEHLRSGVSLLFNLETLEIQKIKFRKNTACTLCYPENVRPQSLWEVSSASAIPDALIVDLRTEENFIPQAMQSYLLVCQRGVKSLERVKVLRSRGFEKVWSLRGGISSLSHGG